MILIWRQQGKMVDHVYVEESGNVTDFFSCDSENATYFCYDAYASLYPFHASFCF